MAKNKKMRFGKVFTDGVDIPERLRRTDADKVKALAESMEAIGLQQPISVWSPDATTCDLVGQLTGRSGGYMHSRTPGLKLMTKSGIGSLRGWRRNIASS